MNCGRECGNGLRFSDLDRFSEDTGLLGRELKAVQADQAAQARVSTIIKARIESQKTELREFRDSIARLSPLEVILHFTPDSSILSEGIIAFLTRKCGGNIHCIDCVRSFSNSVSCYKHPPCSVANLSSDSYFCSGNAPNQSIGYDFKDDRTVRPTHYAIRSAISWAIVHYPKSWMIEVTNDFSDSNSWVEIDRRDNCPDLNGRGTVKAFAISRPPSGEFRYIRLRQTGAN
jgi:hypothetical protein